MGIRKELIEREGEERKDKDGILVERIKWRREVWRVIGVSYVSDDIKEKLEVMKGWMEEKEKDVRTLIGGGDL